MNKKNRIIAVLLIITTVFSFVGIAKNTVSQSAVPLINEAAPMQSGQTQTADSTNADTTDDIVVGIVVVIIIIIVIYIFFGQSSSG